MTEVEAREFCAIQKWGEPCSDWQQNRPNTYTNGFGVLDSDGKAIRGLQVEFDVFVAPRTGLMKFIFSLRRAELGRLERAYQMEINCRSDLRVTDHQYSHEHYGEEVRNAAEASWANLGFDDAVKAFCDRCNLTLTSPLPDYRGFNLR